MLIFVFTPQIVENFRRRSAEGLSIVFIVIWLLGDFFNIIGALLQGVLPTMIILAVYYTVADIVLLIQCFYYRGFTLSDAPQLPKDDDEHAILDGTEQEQNNEDANETAHGQPQEQEEDHTPLLSRSESPAPRAAPQMPTLADFEGSSRRSSASFASISPQSTERI